MERTRSTIAKHLFGAALLLLAMAQCNNGDDATFPECAGHVSPGVSSGLTPSVDWEPACTLVEVSISDVASGTLVWSVLGVDAINQLEPGISYGTVPEAGQELLPPLALIAGHKYRVSVYWLDLANPLVPAIRLSGEATFTP